ncbi:hypothetical protein D0A34_00215 [Microcoleus vaginatus PCC 9802]|nr:hypothetical protein D0A34_00215 [Microcoleus vaginatus PCC 9802]
MLLKSWHKQARPRQNSEIESVKSRESQPLQDFHKLAPKFKTQILNTEEGCWLITVNCRNTEINVSAQEQAD